MPRSTSPASLCLSHFTYMHELGVSVAGEVFDHLLDHFVLTYSNWEHGSIWFSESYESLSGGLQAALWGLGAVPWIHSTDGSGKGRVLAALGADVAVNYRTTLRRRRRHRRSAAVVIRQAQ